MKRIYLHGLGQTPESWSKTILRMEDGAHSECPDLVKMLRGGRADYAALYDGFAAFCDAFDEGIDLCGLSLGGVLALNYAIDHPQKLRSLALIAARYEMPRVLLAAQNVLFRCMPEAMFRQTGFGKRAFIQLCGSMARLDFGASLQAVTCPTLVVCGARDSANRRAAAKLAGALRDAELRIIPDAGHEVNVEAPERLAAELCEFYGRLSGI